LPPEPAVKDVSELYTSSAIVPTPDLPSPPTPISPTLFTSPTSHNQPIPLKSAITPTVNSLHRKRFSGSNIWTLLRGNKEDKVTGEGKPKRGSRFTRVLASQRQRKRGRRTAMNGDDWTVVDEDGDESNDEISETRSLPGLPVTTTSTMESVATVRVSSPLANPSRLTLDPLDLPPSSAPMTPTRSSEDPLAEVGKRTPTALIPSPNPSSASSNRTAPVHAISPSLRFAHVIDRMQDARLSVSPGVKIPPPHLLSRLRQEEMANSASVADGPSHPLAVDDSRPTLLRHRSFADADVRTLAHGFAHGTAAIVGADPLSMPTTPASTMSRASGRMAADTRAGLTSLMGGNASATGMFRHQSLQYLVESRRVDALAGDPICQAPMWTTVAYYADKAAHGLTPDVRLGEWVDGLVEGRDVACACGVAAKDHVTSYVHSDTRIEARIAAAKEEYPAATNTEDIVMWTSCLQCAEVTPVRNLVFADGWILSVLVQSMIMSSGTSLVSFACVDAFRICFTGLTLAHSKLLELLIYDVELRPDIGDSCAHVSADTHCAVRHFRLDETVVSLTLKTVIMHELRLPMPINVTDPERLDSPPTPPSERDEADVEAIARECVQWSLCQARCSQGARTDVDASIRPSVTASRTCARSARR
jgi:hypothetical protein